MTPPIYFLTALVVAFFAGAIVAYFLPAIKARAEKNYRAAWSSLHYGTADFAFTVVLPCGLCVIVAALTWPLSITLGLAYLLGNRFRKRSEDKATKEAEYLAKMQKFCAENGIDFDLLK